MIICHGEGEIKGGVRLKNDQNDLKASIKCQNLNSDFLLWLGLTLKCQYFFLNSDQFKLFEHLSIVLIYYSILFPGYLIA